MSTRGRKQPVFKAKGGAKGFSVLELTVVVLISLVLSSLAIPAFMTMQHNYRLNGTAGDFAGLVQIQRLRAVDDDRYYSTYLIGAGSNKRAFVDIYPQNVNGSSGTGGATFTCTATGCDPIVPVNQEVSQLPATSAPGTAALRALFLPASSPIVPKDGMLAASPITFGPNGLPCTPQAATGGTVCDTLGGQTAYWTFFQDNVSQNWVAVTVTPAGRIQRWVFGGGVAGTWSNF